MFRRRCTRRAVPAAGVALEAGELWRPDLPSAPGFVHLGNVPRRGRGAGGAAPARPRDGRLG
ncbi:MAG: hypothetical protein FJZ97_10870 [Chloroflexi bacterium]|nr:hypothetical protein [Chloroflexota bacterium]